MPGIAVLEAVDAAQPHAAVGAADGANGMQRYRVVEEQVSAPLACVAHRRVRVLACAKRVPHQPKASRPADGEDFGGPIKGPGQWFTTHGSSGGTVGIR